MSLVRCTGSKIRFTIGEKFQTCYFQESVLGKTFLLPEGWGWGGYRSLYFIPKTILIPPPTLLKMIFFPPLRTYCYFTPIVAFCLDSSLFCIYFTLLLPLFYFLFSLFLPFSFPIIPFSLTFSSFFIFFPWMPSTDIPPPRGGDISIYRTLGEYEKKFKTRKMLNEKKEGKIESKRIKWRQNSRK